MMDKEDAAEFRRALGRRLRVLRMIRELSRTSWPGRPA